MKEARWMDDTECFSVVELTVVPRGMIGGATRSTDKHTQQKKDYVS